MLFTASSCSTGNYQMDPIDHILMTVGTTGNTDDLCNLLKSGFPVNRVLPGLLGEGGGRLLNVAIFSNQPGVVRLLLDHGATIGLRDEYGRRAIDQAYKAGNTNICEILAIDSEQSEILAGAPILVWEELVPEIKAALWDPRPIFVSLNGADPPPELLRWISARKGRETKDAFPRSDATQLKWGEIPHSGTQYQHKTSGAFGYVLELTIGHASDSSYTFRIRSAIAEALSGGVCYGSIVNAYGYWIKTDKESWIE
jgi:hypothetical protein